MGIRNRWPWIASGVLLSALGTLIVAEVGAFEMTAADGAGLLDWWGDTAWRRSLVWRSPSTGLPDSVEAAKGFEHYRDMCVVCHGAPDVSPAEWSGWMLPKPPKLWEADAQHFSDGKLFYIVKNGVRMTGMPAFGKDHSDQDIWNIVAFLRRLPHLTDDQQGRLQADK